MCKLMPYAHVSSFKTTDHLTKHILRVLLKWCKATHCNLAPKGHMRLGTPPGHGSDSILQWIHAVVMNYNHLGIRAIQNEYKSCVCTLHRVLLLSFCLSCLSISRLDRADSAILSIPYLLGFTDSARITKHNTQNSIHLAKFVITSRCYNSMSIRTGLELHCLRYAIRQMPKCTTICFHSTQGHITEPKY